MKSNYFIFKNSYSTNFFPLKIVRATNVRAGFKFTRQSWNKSFSRLPFYGLPDWYIPFIGFFENTNLSSTVGKKIRFVEVPPKVIEQKFLGSHPVRSRSDSPSLRPTIPCYISYLFSLHNNKVHP